MCNGLAYAAKDMQMTAVAMRLLAVREPRTGFGTRGALRSAGVADHSAELRARKRRPRPLRAQTQCGRRRRIIDPNPAMRAASANNKVQNCEPSCIDLPEQRQRPRSLAYLVKAASRRGKILSIGTSVPISRCRPRERFTLDGQIRRETPGPERPGRRSQASRFLNGRRERRDGPAEVSSFQRDIASRAPSRTT